LFTVNTLLDVCAAKPPALYSTFFHV
jgi:hypothetical protein